MSSSAGKVRFRELFSPSFSRNRQKETFFLLFWIWFWKRWGRAVEGEREEAAAKCSFWKVKNSSSLFLPSFYYLKCTVYIFRFSSVRITYLLFSGLYTPLFFSPSFIRVRFNFAYPLFGVSLRILRLFVFRLSVSPFDASTIFTTEFYQYACWENLAVRWIRLFRQDQFYFSERTCMNRRNRNPHFSRLRSRISDDTFQRSTSTLPHYIASRFQHYWAFSNNSGFFILPPSFFFLSFFSARYCC